MAKIFLRNSTIASLVFFFLTNTKTIAQYTNCGEYERRWLGIIPIYECSFHVRDEKNTLSTLLNQSHRPTIDALAAHITDTANRISYRLEIIPLLSLKRYGSEKDALRGTLHRAGFAVDDHWRLLLHAKHQSDVDLYVNSLLGKDEDHPGDFYRTRARGDRFILEVRNGTAGQLTYISSQMTAVEKKVTFKSAELLKGIILTYISERQCSEELRDDLPGSLLKKFLPINDR